MSVYQFGDQSLHVGKGAGHSALVGVVEGEAHSQDDAALAALALV